LGKVSEIIKGDANELRLIATRYFEYISVFETLHLYKSIGLHKDNDSHKIRSLKGKNK